MENFKDKVVYQIYPKSFKDSNNDGVGDLQGIIQKIDYLDQMGVDYLWLTPIFPSPQNDNGYDISDYYSVDPLFGSMEDLEALIDEADKRGIGLMLDMVFNHTSTEHEWFKKALAGDKKYQDFYFFKDGDADHPPTNWESKFGGNAWEYVPELGKWYLHLYDKTQADLNWENPEVRKELKKIIRFWKNKGIKGFRFDVLNVTSKPDVFIDDNISDGRRFYTDGPRIHEYLKELVANTDLEENLTVGEMSSTTLDNCIKYTNPDENELDMVFNFHHLKVDYKDGDKWSVEDFNLNKLKKIFKLWQEGMQAGNGWNALFWDNHDQPRTLSRYGNDKEYWEQAAKMLAGCMMLMRGTPYIYQGDEIGMVNPKFTSIDEYRDVESLNYYKILLEQGKTPQEALDILSERSRDNGRTPMQWNSEMNAGFTNGKPWINLPDNYNEINVQSQLEDEESILNFYKELIRLRKELPVISDGEIIFSHMDVDDVLAYRRIKDDDEILVVSNFSDKEIPLELPLIFKDSDVLLSNYDVILNNYGITESKANMVLRPYELIVLRKTN